MTAGLINIISVGANDLYLTGAPQITLFKIVYRRYTNFSKESVSIPINNLQFGTSVDIPIPKNADLLGELYIQIQLPSVNFTKEQLFIENPVSNVLYPNAFADYQTILNFMVYNTSGYRTALSDVKAIGVSPTLMITDIINSFGTFDTELYDTTLNTYYSNYIENKIYTYDFLNPILSNILTISNNILADIYNNVNGWTNEKILARITSAIQTSTQVQQYFFNNTLITSNANSENTTPNAKFAWVDRLAHTIIDYVDVYIGGEKIERTYGDWINIWYELTGNKEQIQLYNKMIGNIKALTTFDRNMKPSYLITCPLSFWFCRNVGLSLPLIALQYHDVKISLKLKELQDCAYVEYSDSSNNVNLQDIWDDNGYMLNANLLADYVYLDVIERKRFAVSAHEYLIERVQDMVFDNITDNTISVDLDFRSPCKEIIWVVQKLAYIDNSLNYNKSMWNNYGVNPDGTGNPILDAQLSFNGYQRFNSSGSKVAGSYFNYVQPYSSHSNTPSNDKFSVPTDIMLKLQVPEG